jgi:hypothetical protein
VKVTSGSRQMTGLASKSQCAEACPHGLFHRHAEVHDAGQRVLGNL